MDRFLTRRTTILFVAAFTFWRLYLSATLQLHPDEAYYWLWSKHLDYGYFDHAPMVAYFIRLGTLFSDAELWVRLTGGMLVPVLMSVLLWRLALQLYHSVAVASVAVLLFNASPLASLGLLVMSPDVPLLLFWALGTCMLWEIVRSGRVWLWYALGVVYGLTLLSKYTGVLFGPCVLFFLLLSDERRWLKTPHPYLAVLLGLLLFMPVVYWNSQHDWISFTFQFSHGLEKSAHSWGQVLTYLAGQALLVGPLTWLLGACATAVACWRRDKAGLLLVATSLPVIAFFGTTSYNSLAGPNWPAMAYFSFSLLAGSVMLLSRAWLRHLLWSLALFFSLALSLLITTHARFAVLSRFMSEPARIADATNFVHGWKELAQSLERDHPPGFLLVSSHQLAAELIYYSDQHLTVYVDPQSRPSQFNLWPGPTNLQGRSGLQIWADIESVPRYNCYFSSVSRLGNFQSYRAGYKIRRFRIIEGQDSRLGPTLPNCLRDPRSEPVPRD